MASIFDNSLFYSFRNNTMSTILFVGGLCLFKSFATSATNGGGGVGGTFAPSLYVGCMAGFFFAYTLNAVGFASPSVPLSIKNFALLGMAGVMAGVMQAPLMAIFLTAEKAAMPIEVMKPMNEMCSDRNPKPPTISLLLAE